jgi:hypothetical protein
MTKTTLTLAAVLLAGTTLSNTAFAGGVRVGFGFPLGSFVAHSNQSYASDGYGYQRHCDRERSARRMRHTKIAASRKLKRVRKVQIANVKPTPAPTIKTAKLEGKLESNPATTTEIAKTTTTPTTPIATGSVTTSSVTPAKETKESAPVSTAANVKSSEPVKSDLKTSITAAKKVCRRYSAAIAGLIDVPCNE